MGGRGNKTALSPWYEEIAALLLLLLFFFCKLDQAKKEATFHSLPWYL